MALGSVATATFTRAEIDTMLKKAMYSNGKVTGSGATSFSYNEDGVLHFSEDTDYVALTCYSCSQNVAGYYQLPNGTKLARGGSISTPGNYHCTISFSTDGTLRFIGYCAMSKSERAYYTAEGYHYY